MPLNIDNNADYVYIIWPEKRTISKDQLWMWYMDGISNGDIAEEYIGAHDLETVCRALSDAGTVTFGDQNNLPSYKNRKFNPDYDDRDDNLDDWIGFDRDYD